MGKAQQPARVAGEAEVNNWNGIERRGIYEHLPTKPFVIRRFVEQAPWIEGAAYGCEMVERRKIPDRRKKQTGKPSPEDV